MRTRTVEVLPKSQAHQLEHSFQGENDCKRKVHEL